MHRRLIIFALSLSLTAAPAVAANSQAPTIFKKVDFYTQDGDDMEDHDAQLIIDVQRRVFVFANEDHANRVFATVDWDRLTGVSYENSKHARITAGLLIAWPMLFMKGKKHWLTLTYGPGDDGSPGGYVFARMDKNNFQTILAAINGFTGVEIRRIEEDGQISILYPGTVGARTETTAVTQGTARNVAAPSTTTTSSSAVSAGVLPAKTNEVSAGALPPAPGPVIKQVVLLNKGVQWTDRTPDAVGYIWAAELGNNADTELYAAVVLTLYSASGTTLHQTRQAVAIPAGDVADFTAAGEVAEAQALQADHWDFEIEVATSRMSEPIPLTDEMVAPKLIPESVKIVTTDPALKQIKLAGTLITIRCLVRADGSVADARVFEISSPNIPGANNPALKEAIRASAVEHWQFTPAEKAGLAVAVWHMVNVRYDTRK